MLFNKKCASALRKAAAVVTAGIMAAAFSSCSIGQDKTDMDTYHYDGVFGAQWGATPDEAANQMQLTRSQWVRLEDDQLEGLPEGTIGYEITRTTMMFGLYMTTEAYFTDSIDGAGEYLGLYAIKCRFFEDPEYYSQSDLSLCDEDFKLNGEDALEEFQARALYNRNVSYGTYTDESGTWDTISWSCDSTIDSVEADESVKETAKATLDAIDECLKDWNGCFASVKEAPLSSATIFYNNTDGESYILFSGLPAAALKDAE